MSSFFKLTLSELSALIQSNEISVEFVLSEYLDRIKIHNPDLNAIVSMVSEQHLFEQAREIDKIRDKTTLNKPLLGIPIAIKDLESTKNIKTTFGSKIFKNNIPNFDGVMANKIRSAGAIIIGKTNTPEFGIGSHTFNNVFGSTKNPYNKNLSAGGSSGGAACAITANLLPVADGSDMMGSLRNPAAFNNIYGFRPTVGLVPNDDGLKDTSLIFSTTGPMGKTPEDLAFLLDVMVSPNQVRVKDLNLEAGKGKQDVKEKSVKNLSIGWLSDLIDQYDFEDGIIDLCQDCMKTLSYCGVKTSSVISKIPKFKLWSSWTSLRSVSLKKNLTTMFDVEEHYHNLKNEIRWEITNADNVDKYEMQRAIANKKEIMDLVNALFRKYDFLALPSAAVFPFDVNLHYPKSIAGKTMDTYHRWMEVVVLVSLLGLPCISLPCGLSGQNLPTGLQIFGRPYSDIDILRLAKTYSKTTDKDKLRPILD